ncbi:uncharacterized protein LOC101453417 [Ceratitis capitata]|uniref:uncharacterized protein LOC101453417 n=1 Tax=Ceratitis capitata TaxID=7213 RepID=UPI000329827C|nr:uncharacterized protein LOC101453417 [Ceratitis capitata]
MYKNWSILFLVACLTLQLVASFPKRDALEILDNQPEKSPGIEIYQQQRRQSRQPDDFDDLRGIVKQERELLKDIIRNINTKNSQNGQIQAVGSDAVVDDIVRFIRLEFQFLSSLINKLA